MTSVLGGLCLGWPDISLPLCEHSAFSLSVQNIMVPLAAPCQHSLFLVVASVTLSSFNSKFAHLFQLVASGWLLVPVLPLPATLVLMFQSDHNFSGWTLIPTSGSAPLVSNFPRPTQDQILGTLTPEGMLERKSHVLGHSVIMRGQSNFPIGILTEN